MLGRLDGAWRGAVTGALTAGLGFGGAKLAGRWLPNCFPAGTLVSTASGLQPIETIEASEWVWAFDLLTGSWHLCRVLETYRQEGSVELVALTAAGETTEATAHHPYWVVAGEELEGRPQPEHIPDVPANAAVPGRWVDAIDLRVGDVLLLRSGERVPVTGLAVRQSTQAVYNFYVEGLHCYAVGKSAILSPNGFSGFLCNLS